ncbi:MAG: sigma-70 family RNA polymerase sigma factor [Phycisphaeraceae bacterium]|nr:sigma-70 family RNA polymerase sigma factor [Phycisphaeraceae bacterium]MCB9847228.1 sigma-70 family RNA polymerase sigma factor [Phycisphaeraceae bacterium]
MNREEFEHLALEQLDPLHRMAMQLCRRHDEAADLVQETFLRALKAADRFEDQGLGVRPWMYRILFNTFYTRRKRDSRGPASIAEFFAEESRETEPCEPPPAWNMSSFDWEHVDERIKAAVEDLKPEYRAVLLLWGVEGLKYREIAQIVDTPIGTVMSRLHRARKLLADALADCADELGIRSIQPDPSET